MTVAAVVERAFKEGIRPTEFLTVSEWADKYRIIPDEGGAKEPGKWRNSRFPFLREPMDNLSPFSGVEETIIMAGVQVGKTETGMNFMGHTIHINPDNFLILMPTIDLARRRSKTKIKHTIAYTPVLNSRVAKARERDSDNTTLMKAYPGGTLVVSGANSAASLSDLSAKCLHLDEVDRYVIDLENEGDTLALALNRASSFGREKRVLFTSTPTLRDNSAIEREFLNSDQRHYYVPCPFCHHMQHLRWKDGEWDKPGELRFVFKHDNYELQGDVCYRCEACKELIPEYKKDWMFAERGFGGMAEWRPHKPGHLRRGYKLPSFYSPLGFMSWNAIFQGYLYARKEYDIKRKTGPIKTWLNTKAAETWIDNQPEIDITPIIARREDYGEVVPAQATVLVAFADVQDNRLECLVRAFGPGKESWGMDHIVFPGNPEANIVWDRLGLYLSRPWKHQSGRRLFVRFAFVDSGYLARRVYEFTIRRYDHNIFASKGSQFPTHEVITREPSIKNASRCPVFFIGTNEAKSKLFSRIAIETKGPLYMHWNKQFDEEYFKQLLQSEKPVWKKGVKVWDKVNPSARNEALDMEAGCLAIIELLNPDFDAETEHLKNTPWHGEEIEDEKEPVAVPAAAGQQPVSRAAEQQHESSAGEERSSFLGQARKGGWLRG